jgi:hypothetical protein
LQPVIGLFDLALPTIIRDRRSFRSLRAFRDIVHLHFGNLELRTNGNFGESAKVIMKVQSLIVDKVSV